MSYPDRCSFWTGLASLKLLCEICCTSNSNFIDNFVEFTIVRYCGCVVRECMFGGMRRRKGNIEESCFSLNPSISKARFYL